MSGDDDARIERYSRQLILAEVGPRGQARLAAARVAVAASGPGAERAVAYLAAAGVGTIALAPALRALVDPAQPGIRLDALEDAAGADFDAALVAAHGAAADDTATGNVRTVPRAPRTFWIGDGRAAEIPPCAACAATALGTAPGCNEILAPVRDAVLGTVVATEMLKAILDVGTPLAGHVLAYDPETATLTRIVVASRPDCARCRAGGRSSSAPSSPRT